MNKPKLYCLGVCKNSTRGVAVNGIRFEHKDEKEIKEILKIVKRGEWEIYFCIEESEKMILRK